MRISESKSFPLFWLFFDCILGILIHISDPYYFLSFFSSIIFNFVFHFIFQFNLHIEKMFHNRTHISESHSFCRFLCTFHIKVLYSFACFIVNAISFSRWKLSFWRLKFIFQIHIWNLFSYFIIRFQFHNLNSDSHYTYISCLYSLLNVRLQIRFHCLVSNQFCF